MHVRENFATRPAALALVLDHVAPAHPLALAHGAPCHLEVSDAWERLTQRAKLPLVRFPLVLQRARPISVLEVFLVLGCQVLGRADLKRFRVLPKPGEAFDQPMLALGDESSDQLALSSQHPSQVDVVVMIWFPMVLAVLS